MFPGFSGNYAILISPALGQRTAKRVKVLPAFSKAAGCRAEPYGPKGVARGVGLACRLGRRWTVPTGHQRPCLPKRQQKWGDGCPPLGVAPRPGLALCAARSRLPARSALNGAHRAPAPPDEGSCVPVARAQDRPERKRRPLRKDFRRKPFLPSCVCRRRRRSWDAVPHPATFEKVGETFTCLSQA